MLTTISSSNGISCGCCYMSEVIETSIEITSISDESKISVCVRVYVRVFVHVCVHLCEHFHVCADNNACVCVHVCVCVCSIKVNFRYCSKNVIYLAIFLNNYISLVWNSLFANKFQEATCLSTLLILGLQVYTTLFNMGSAVQTHAISMDFTKTAIIPVLSDQFQILFWSSSVSAL